MRATVAHLQALEYSRGGQLPFGLFDAVALSEEEAGFVQTDTNIEILIAQTRAEARR